MVVLHGWKMVVTLLQYGYVGKNIVLQRWANHKFSFDQCAEVFQPTYIQQTLNQLWNAVGKWK